MEGAEAPEKLLGPILRDVVTGLLHLSPGEQERLNSYSQNGCHVELQEIADYVNNPAGKPERIIQDVIGELFLLYQCQTHLQITEYQNQVPQLQKSNASRWQEVQTTQAEQDQARGSLNLLQREVRTAHQGTGFRPEEN